MGIFRKGQDEGKIPGSCWPKLQEIDDINMAVSVSEVGPDHLHAAGRGRCARTADGHPGRLSQEKLIDPAIGRLLDELQPWAESLPYDVG